MVGSAAGVVLLGGVRDVPETPWRTLVLFSGFILVFVIEMLVH